VFVVAVTIKTESLNGFPIALQNFIQKDLVASSTKLFPLPPDPVNSLLAFPVLPLPITLGWLYPTLKYP